MLQNHAEAESMGAHGGVYTPGGHMNVQGAYKCTGGHINVQGAYKCGGIQPPPKYKNMPTTKK